MWAQTTWWIVGAAALAFTAMSLLGLRERVVALVIGDAAALFLWAVWAINAFAVEQVTNAGVSVTYNYPGLGYIGFGLAVIVALDLFLAVLEALQSAASEESRGEPDAA